MYVTPDEVKEFTGSRFEDFNVANETELDELLTRWAGQVKDMIDRDRRRDFFAEAGEVLEAVPGVVRSVALRAMGNFVRLAINMRESGLVRLDEWRVGVDQEDQVLTRSLRRELRLSFGAKASSRVRGFVSHAPDETP